MLFRSLCRLEAKGPSFRMAFCLALSGLAILVVANKVVSVPDVIRTKSMQVMDGTANVASIAIYDRKAIFGSTNGTRSLVSIGEGTTGTGVVVLTGATGKDLIRLTSTKSGGGSVSVYSSDGTEIGNASPNITNTGSLFIQSTAGKLVGEINGDKANGGAIILHDANGTETARVHN